MTLVLLLVSPFFIPLQEHTPLFDSESSYGYLTAQCDFGPRPPGSENLSQCREYIAETLTGHGWSVTQQNFTYQSTECVNIIAKWGATSNTTIILGAHYDTRPRADQDPSPLNRSTPIIGANDGASGVAVLLEIARVLPQSTRTSIEIVLFDAEDSGNINGWDWIVGSRYYVSQMTQDHIERTSAMVLVDMVGDENLTLLRETSSTRSLQDAVWTVASRLGYSDIFLSTFGGSIRDDHSPFLDAGISSLDIIQHHPFPWYWHTLEDTPDKCSASSLGIVGQVVEVFLVSQVSNGGVFPSDPTYLLYGFIALVAVLIVIEIYSRYRRG